MSTELLREPWNVTSQDLKKQIFVSKPYRDVAWRPISFETLQVEILVPRQGGAVGARHSKTFML